MAGHERFHRNAGPLNQLQGEREAVGEAGDQLIEGQLGGSSAANWAHELGLLAEMREEWPLFFEDLLFAAGHHQQRSIQRLWFAAEHRGFQILPSLVRNLCGELATFLNSHGPHRDHR